MSVVEFIVAMGVSLAILAIAIALLIFSVQNYKVATDKVEIRTIGSGITQTMMRVFSFSNKVITVPGAVTPNILLGQPSELRLGSWTSITATPPGTRLAIANIRRDTGVGAVPAAGRYSRYRQTGVFYILPTPTTSGVLFFDMGTEPATNLTPSYDDLYFDRLVELVIDRPQYVTVNGVQYLKSVHVRVVARHFMTDNKSRWRWCPQSDIDSGVANCASGAFNDYVTDLNLMIPNQIMRVPTLLNSLTTAERIMGPIYFFPFVN